MFLLCEGPRQAIGSCLSVFGELRGDAVREEVGCADEGVGRRVPVFGERLTSAALRGVPPPEVADAGVVS